MIVDLEEAQKSDKGFITNQYINQFDAKKHDHFF